MSPTTEHLKWILAFSYLWSYKWATRNGESGTSYITNEAIKKVIDLYFQKLNEFIDRQKNVSKNQNQKLLLLPNVLKKQPELEDDSPEPEKLPELSKR